MFGLQFFVANLQSRKHGKRYTRKVIVSQVNRTMAELALTCYLIEINWPTVGDTLKWHLDGLELAKIDLDALLTGNGGCVALGNDSVSSINTIAVTPATQENSEQFKKEDDIDPDTNFYPCTDCKPDGYECANCIYFFDWLEGEA